MSTLKRRQGWALAHGSAVSPSGAQSAACRADLSNAITPRDKSGSSSTTKMRATPPPQPLAWRHRVTQARPTRPEFPLRILICQVTRWDVGRLGLPAPRAAEGAGRGTQAHYSLNDAARYTNRPIGP